MQELQSINPSDGSVVWTGAATPVEKLPEFATAATAAFVSWSMRSLQHRESVLRAFSEVINNRAEELAITISKEIGKPLWESRTEVAAISGKVDISIQAHRERCREFPGGKAITRFRPHGLVVVIGPYNFPGHLPNGHICPALLAGNTVLFKPSELAPATGELLVRCWHEAGVPPDVLQVVQGGASVARALTGLTGIKGVFFTGSVRTGKILLKQFAERPGTILALEMGGNNPLIVDTNHIGDLDAAIQIVLKSAFLSAGQRCTCARRLILLASNNNQVFIEGLIRAVSDLRVDHPFADPEPFMGPLASPSFPQEILEKQNMLVKKGGKPLLESAAMRTGTGFLSPGIIDVSAVSDLPDEEIFGPVLQIQHAKDLDEAVALANNTRFGLASGILTDKRPDYEYVLPRLQAGILNWNTPLTGASSAAPFGGIGDSGNHRPSAYFAADYCSFPVASIEADRCE